MQKKKTVLCFRILFIFDSFIHLKKVFSCFFRCTLHTIFSREKKIRIRAKFQNQKRNTLHRRCIFICFSSVLMNNSVSSFTWCILVTIEAKQQKKFDSDFLFYLLLFYKTIFSIFTSSRSLRSTGTRLNTSGDTILLHSILAQNSAI